MEWEAGDALCRRAERRRDILPAARLRRHARLFAHTMHAMPTNQTTFFGLPKLPARYASLVLPFFLTCVMTCVVSGISTLRVAGIGPGVLSTWLVSWGLSWAVAYPTMLLVLPSVKKLAAALVASE